ncbi:TMV resistance protein N-like [Pyrus ussuriensis x Pyrus communis]|uniref:TMV resistance protein N-like n=1 Tax=Pyrus ussuriensis x Pyrus communis TaxID=2448454 RepID=A0A5N5FID6_9ROSA|nr:TMV resistance protein N-like [Pyrus ussuriensis x Pyrus communis]
MRVATAPANFKEEECYKDITSGTSVSIVYEGNEIPNWFSHQNNGCSITIKLPLDWYMYGADAQLRIMRVASAPSIFEEKDIEEAKLKRSTAFYMNGK